MTEKIGLQAVLEDQQFNRAVTGYVGNVAKMDSANQRAVSSGNRLNAAVLNMASGIYIAEKAYHAIVKAIDATIGKYMDYALQVGDMAVATGATVEQASMLVQVADDSRIAYATLQVAMREMVKDGTQPTIENMARLSDQFLAIEDPVKRAQFAMDKFGTRAGTEMVKMMEKGGDAILAMGEAARSTGLVLDEAAVATAQELYAAIDTLEDEVNGLVVSFGAALAPALVEIIGLIIDFVGVLKDGIQTLDVLISWNQEIAAVYGIHAAEMRDLTDDYGEYIKELERAARANGLAVNSEGDLVQTYENAPPAIRDVTNAMLKYASGADQVVVSNYAMSESEFEAYKHNQEFGTGFWNTAMRIVHGSDVVGGAVVALTANYSLMQQSELEATNAATLLADALSGKLQKAHEAYTDTLAKAAEQRAELNVQLDEAIKKYGDNSKEADALRLKLKGVNDEEAKAEEQLKRTTREFIYQKAAAGLDATASLELARTMGLVDEKSYQVSKGVMLLKDAYDTNRDGAIDATEAAAGYTDAVLDYQTAVEEFGEVEATAQVSLRLDEYSLEAAMGKKVELASAISSTVRILVDDSAFQAFIQRAQTAISTIIGAIGGLGGNYAAGGMGQGSFAIVGEHGPEISYVPKGGYVLNSRQAAAAVGNITNEYNLTMQTMNSPQVVERSFYMMRALNSRR